MGVTLESVQNKFSFMIEELANEPDLLSQFAVWLDLRLAEYKLKGNMSSACLNEDPGLPIWLKGLKTHIFNTAGVKQRADTFNFQCLGLPLPETSSVSNIDVCANFEDLALPQTSSDIPAMQNSPDVSFSVATCDLDVKQEPLFPLGLYFNANLPHSKLSECKSNTCLNEDKQRTCSKKRRLSKPTQILANQNSQKLLSKPTQILANQNSQKLLSEPPQILANQTSGISLPPKESDKSASKGGNFPRNVSANQQAPDESGKSDSKGGNFPRIVSTSSLATDYDEQSPKSSSAVGDNVGIQQENLLINIADGKTGEDVIPVKREPQTIFPVSLFTNEQSDKFRIQELNPRTQHSTHQQHGLRKKQTGNEKPKYRSKKSTLMPLSKVPNGLETSQKSAEMGDNPPEVLELSPPSLPIVTDSNVEAGVTDYCNLSKLSDLDNKLCPWTETNIDGEQEPRGNYGSYTVDQKKKALEVLESTSLRRASMCLGIPRSTISTWRRQLEVGKEETVKRPRGRGVTYDKHVDFEIRDWVLAQQNNRRGISRQAISEYARQKVNRPGFRAKDGWLQKFLKRHNLTLNFTKRKMQQQNTKEMQKKIDKFNQQLSTVWRNSTFDHVINMDEIFVTFPHKPPKIIDGECKRIKNIDDDPNGIEVKPLTIVLAIDTKGQMLPPLVIFKGESLPPDIESIHKGVHFRLQENGYMTEELMADWLDTVLLPHTEKKSTLLIMDSYEAHTSPVITKKVYEMNVTSVIIPGGCIQRLQPLDASINSPFRYHVRKYWEEYKKANPDLVKGKSQDVSREVMLDCVRRAWNYMNNKKRSIVKSFRVTGISNVIAKAKDLPENSETVEETAEETMEEAEAQIMVDTSMDESWLSDSSDMEDFPGFTATDLDN